MNVEAPRFETRVFAESPQVVGLIAHLPEVRRALFETGIPKGLLGGRYLADPELTVLAREGLASVVRFGTSGRTDAIGVAVDSGNVVDIIDVPWVPANFVNTTVGLFTRTVQALVERFPYYSKDAEWVEIDSVCVELRKIIRSIDAGAVMPDYYWPTFVDDVQMGDFSTEDILMWQRRNAI